MCDEWCDLRLPVHVHAVIQTQGIRNLKAREIPVRDEMPVLWTLTKAQWDSIPNPRRKKALITISEMSDVPKSFNPKADMWNETGSGLTRLCKVADGTMTFVDAEIDYANGRDPSKVSKEERQTMAAASACSQLTQIPKEHIPKPEKSDHDERWRTIKIQKLHYDEYAKMLDRFGPGTAYEDGPEAAGIDKHFWRALDEGRQVQEAILRARR